MEVGGVLDNPDRSPLPLVDYLKVSYNSSLLPQQEKSTNYLSCKRDEAGSQKFYMFK